MPKMILTSFFRIHSYTTIIMERYLQPEIELYPILVYF